jgi:hypothetical protein
MTRRFAPIILAVSAIVSENSSDEEITAAVTISGSRFGSESQGSQIDSNLAGFS